jgi:vacuolar-type H+-ATPase catalytic subunit A/Vma1
MKHKVRVNRVIEELDPVFRSLSKQAEEYVNENRVLSAISKLGEPESMKDFSTYIREITRDYQEDFRKEHEEEITNLDKEEIKKIFKSGNNYATVLLKKYILKGGKF